MNTVPRIALIIAALFSHMAMADISQYAGKVYYGDEVSNCLEDYARITKELEEETDFPDSVGFKVIEGGCVPHGNDVARIQFSYKHPVTYRIERLSRDFSSSKVCQENSAKAKSSFLEGGFHFVDSFCRGKSLNVDFVDFGGKIISFEMFDDFSFKTEVECSQFLANTEAALKADGVQTLFPTCSKIDTLTAGTVYEPSANLSARYTKTVKVLRGASYEGERACLENQEEVRKRFASHGLILSYGFCSTGYQPKEYLIYIEKNFLSKVKKFKGQVYEDKSECELQLERAEQRFSAMRRSPLYSFCSKSYNKYAPVIYYANRY